MTASIHLRPVENQEDAAKQAVIDRRADIDAKAVLVGELLKEVECDGLLLMEPENVAWFTSGASARNLPDGFSSPAIYCNGDSRWLIAGNADSQRFFDEEIDGLGFQLKEWPWHLGRDRLLTDLFQNRRAACDRTFEGTHLAADWLRRRRMVLSAYEQACHRALGALVAHALEAACRTMAPNENEREVAGQIAHRLMHRGAIPLYVGVAADGRSRDYRHFGFTTVPIRRCAVMMAAARKYGLVATASRSVCFGASDDAMRKEHNAVCRVGASFLASTWPDAVPREILAAARRIYQISDFEHEWLQCPQGHLTGRLAVEQPITPQTEDLFQAGMAVTWHASAGAAVSCDTFHVTDQGPVPVTPSDNWPLKRIRIQGAELIRPDVLQR